MVNADVSGRGRGASNATTVSILVKTGTTKGGTKGLEAIHDKQMEMDINLTWQAAFGQYFNANIDKMRYVVRRGEPKAPKHYLTETIRAWLGEFKKVRSVYVVHVIDAGKAGRKGQQSPFAAVLRTPERRPERPSAPTPSTSTAANDADAEGGKSSSQKQKSKPGPKRYEKADKRQKGKVKFPSPAKRVKREPSPATSAVSEASTTARPLASAAARRPSPMSIVRPSPASIVRPLPDSATSAPPAKKAKQQSQDVNSRKGVKESAPNTGTGTAGPPLVPPQGRTGPSPPRTSRYAEDDMDITNGVGEQNGNGIGVMMDQDDDDYDVRSQCSQDSQDSQDDLVELGIPNEDFKSVFIKKAMDKFSNAGLLKARQALRDLKNKERGNSWTKFTMACPLPVAVLRELFDV